MERKKFIQLTATAIATGTLITLIDACKKSGNSVDFTLDLNSSSNAALKINGGSLVYDNVIVINDNGTYIAISDVCTHQSCGLSYSSSKKKLNCSCHGSQFDTTGKVLTGPATQDLKVYTATVNGSNLHVTG